MQDMQGSSTIQAKAVVVIRLDGDNVEVVKDRLGGLEVSIHRAAKSAETPGVRFLVLTPKDRP